MVLNTFGAHIKTHKRDLDELITASGASLSKEQLEQLISELSAAATSAANALSISATAIATGAVSSLI
ncbi:unnamed protein product [Ambrosiozyma monospora]|uniref:Unnamed protein product n=1 Tax=Ambrosiozyma monospora TaxID=43982 RepID=A0ACB5SXW2_AMBMO|nr:unnamed protein product [Ambrosiozyma monospora]